jgi:hypothetical protein
MHRKPRKIPTLLLAQNICPEQQKMLRGKTYTHAIIGKTMYRTPLILYEVLSRYVLLYT